MSVVACTGIGSWGAEFSPALGIAASGELNMLEKNLAALAARGVRIDVPDSASPDEVSLGIFPTETEVAEWIQGRSAFREGFVPPIIVAGMRSSAMLRGVWRATRKGKDGYTPRIWVVERDARLSQSGLGGSDLVELIGDDRVEFVIGPDAMDRLRARLLDRLDTSVQHVCVSDDGTPSPFAAEASRMVDEVAMVQERATVRLRARVAAIYAERDVAWWASKLAAAKNGGEPLRVLIPTSRYTTFVQHAANDLAHAFARQGMAAQVLIERDDHSRLSSLAYLEQLAALKPDLIVVINFPRASLGLDLPRNIPVVCWMQDAMPHLFDEKVGNSQGDYDFVMGHIFPELYSKFGYPMNRTMPAVVVADGAKFHRGPIAETERVQHACDMALVSHHSETPEALHERLKREVGKDVAMARVLEVLYPHVQATVHACMGASPIQHLRLHAERVWRESLGEEPPARALSLLTNNYAIPLADRMLRHEVVGWAADLARERGWRLALYGRGWEKNPSHAEFARGELSHGDELRAVYASATVNLHCSLTAFVHQRVIECALSGGVCLLRLTCDAISAPRATLTRSLITLPPDVEEPDRIGYTIADHAGTMPFAALMQRIGLGKHDGVFWISRAKAEATRRLASLHALDQDANWAFGDLSEFGFTSKEALEHLVSRAMESPNWRQSASAMAARRSSQHLTHDMLVKRLLCFMQEKLECTSHTRPIAA